MWLWESGQTFFCSSLNSFAFWESEPLLERMELICAFKDAVSSYGIKNLCFGLSIGQILPTIESTNTGPKSDISIIAVRII